MRRTLSLLSALLLAAALPAGAQTVGGFMRLPGMRMGGAINRDANGIPVIWALSDYDLFFLNGWVHAEDRLFQMDVTRRQASGTLAELLGAAALPSDVQFRAIGIRRAATASANAISPATADALEGYAAGVNAWVATHTLPPEYATLELTRFDPWSALDTLTVAKGLAYNLSLDTSDIDRTVALLTYQQIGAAAGFDGTKLFFQDLYRTSPFDPANTIRSGADAPDAGGLGAGEAASGTSAFAEGIAARSRELVESGALDTARAYLERVAAIPDGLGPFLQRDTDKGSNEWAIAGKNTVNGAPLLANDPHLSLGTPSTLYPLSLRAGSMNVTGYGFAGAPGVILGFNDRITWGATVNYMDVTDIYQETVVPDSASASGLSTIYQGQKEPLTPVPEVFRANNPTNGTKDDVAVVPAGTAIGGGSTIPAASLVVPRRNNGPIIQITLPTASKPQGSALSVAFAGSGPTRELEAFLAFDRARNLDDFKKGLELFDVGSQNFSYADVDGNIAYFTSAEMPIREDLQAEKVSGLPPYFLRNGGGGNEWARRVNSYPGQALNFEILAPSEMPSVVNPDFFVSANNDPIGTNNDNDALNQKRPGGGIYYLNAYTYDSFRGARITQLINQKLAGGKKISFADLQQIQGDAVLIDAQVFVPYLLKAAQNAKVQGAHPVLAALGASPVVAAAIARLSAWDFSTPTGIPEGYDASDVNGKLSTPTQAEIDASVAATIYAFFRGRLIANTVDAVLGSFPVSAPLPDSGRTLVALRYLLDNYATGKGVGASGVPFFNTPGVTATQEEKRDIVLLKSLADGITLASSDTFAAAFGKSTNLGDYRWGKLHRIVFTHPIAPYSIPNSAFPAPLAGLTGIPRQGGFGVVDASSHNVRASTLNGFMFGSGPTRRYVAEMVKGAIKVESSLPGGVSGVPTSPYYVNLLPMWLTNETFPMVLQTGPTLPWIKY